ncbi:peptidoglycan glycosyltransferase [Siccationidurans ginsengisoli]|uniref:peptidoglycan D,D-transpeptidase FtsI family protein n=1 Tax=Hymenobacter TaxID=89966 RepID=UPI001AADFE40|nr:MULTISPECIES: penicillin-binding transpeptidase domain-containing protein [unclassified Hymenobacter]MBO2030570.1 peptidoglycan glycosyltransferase [Hymenobacter sp. BT559]
MRRKLAGWPQLFAALSGLSVAACTGPAPTAPAEEYLECREVYTPVRGRLYDRNGTLLVANEVTYTLSIPKGAPLDTAAFNKLMGWPEGALQARVFAARLPAPPPPHRPAPVPDSTGYIAPDTAKPKPAPPRAQRWPIELAITKPEADSLRRHAREYPRLAVRRRRTRANVASLAAPVLGYQPAAAPEFLYLAQKLARGRYYRLRNSGLEGYYNALLAGHRGAYHPLTDGHGRVHGAWATDTTFQQGQNLHLSLDAKLQAYAERLLGERRGYVVALDPSTGEILACVSAPTYDPSVLTAPGRNAERRALLLDDENRPLLNRPAVQASPPGSVFKLVNAAVALQLGAITDHTPFPCDQSLINCVHPHPQARNLTMALKYSCNPYFYQTLRAVVEPRPDSAATLADTVAQRHAHLMAWRRYVRSFGLDTLLGVDLPREQPGFLPTAAYYDKARRTRNWNFKSIYSLSIGQGEINLTGLQMANVLAIIANRGWYITPHFVKAVGKGGPLARFTERHRTLVDSVQFAALIPGMEAAMQRGGTAELASLADVGITVAGKTGTVQNDEGDDHATFAAFAPATKPKIVVAVYLENAGFGGLSAAPLASLLIEKYLRGHIAPKRKKWENWLRCGDLASQGH